MAKHPGWLSLRLDHIDPFWIRKNYMQIYYVYVYQVLEGKLFMTGLLIFIDGRRLTSVTVHSSFLLGQSSHPPVSTGSSTDLSSQDLVLPVTVRFQDGFLNGQGRNSVVHRVNTFTYKTQWNGITVVCKFYTLIEKNGRGPLTGPHRKK